NWIPRRCSLFVGCRAASRGLPTRALLLVGRVRPVHSSGQALPAWLPGRGHLPSCRSTVGEFWRVVQSIAAPRAGISSRGRSRNEVVLGVLRVPSTPPSAERPSERRDGLHHGLLDRRARGSRVRHGLPRLLTRGSGPDSWSRAESAKGPWPSMPGVSRLCPDHSTFHVKPSRSTLRRLEVTAGLQMLLDLRDLHRPRLEGPRERFPPPPLPRDRVGPGGGLSVLQNRPPLVCAALPTEHP